MATWKRVLLAGDDDSLSTSGGTLTGNLGIPNKLYHNDDTGTYLAFSDGQIDLKGSGGVRLMISDNEHINFYTGSSSDTALNLSSDQSATFYGDITVSKDDGFVYLNNVGTGNDGVYIRGLSSDHMRYHVPATKHFHWEIGGVQKASLDTNGIQIGTAGNNTSTSLRVNTGIIIHKDTGSEGNDVSLTFDRRSDGATAYIKATAGDDGAYATNLSLITKGHNGSAYQLYTGLTIDDEGRALIQGGTPLTAEGVNKRLKIHGSGDNYILTGCYDDNGWGYLNSYNNANGMQFYIDAGIYSFRNGKMMIGVESSGTATSANLFIIGSNTAGDGIKIARGGSSQNALDQYAQLNMNQGTTNLISRGGTSGEGTIALQTTSDGSTHTNRLFVNSNGNIAIGTDYTSPDSLLHIHKASSGSVNSHSSSVLTLENNSSVALQFLSPNSDNNIIYFGDVDDNDVGYIVYQHGSNTLGFVVNGSEAIAIDSSQNVGIGISSPDTLLHIHKATAGSISAHSDAQLAIENSGVTAINLLSATTSHGQILFGDSDDADKGVLGYDQATDKMYIRVNGSNDKTVSVTAGNIDILGSDGTVSGTPDTDGDELVIRNNADAGLSILAGESSGHTSTIVFGSTSDLNGANVFYEYHTKTMKLGTQHSDGILTLRSGNGSNAITIDANQKVGIGTTSPSKALHVIGEARFTMGSASVDFDTVGGDGHMAITDSDGATKINLDAEGDNYLSGGNLGIGESTPLAKCHIFTGDSGITTSANTTADELVIEGSSDSGLSIWTPANKSGTIVFSREGATAVGSMKYHHVNDGTGPNSFIFTAGSATAFTLSSASATIAGTLTVNGDLADISGAHPTLKLTDSDDSNYSAIGYSDGALSIQTNAGDEAGASDTTIFYNHGSNETLRIDSLGNMGLGVVPDTTWLSTRTAFQIGGTASIFGRTNAGAGGDITIGQNVYQHSGGSYRRLDEDVTSMYRQYQGNHEFKVAGSSTDNSTIDYTDALKINNDANIGIGRTALGTAYGVGASNILEIGSSATNTAGTIELVGNTNGADVAIGNILWRNEHNYYASGVNYWGGSGEGVARIQVSNVQGSSTAGEQGSEMTFWTKAFGGDCAKRLTINSIGHIGIGKTPIRILDVEGSLASQYGGGVHNSSTTGHGFFIKGAPNSNNYNAFMVDNQEGTTLHTIKGNGLATFTGDVKIAKASGSSTLSFVPATSQASQIKFWQDDGSTQEARIFAPEGSKDLAFEAGTVEALRLTETEATVKENLKVEGALSVDGAYPFMINASADWKGTSSELNMPFTESGTTTASPSIGSDLKNQMTWVAPFATTLRAIYATSETAVTNAQFKVEVASTYSVFVNNTATTTTTYTKSFTTGASANISCGLAIAKGNALRFSINPNSTAVDQFLVTFIFE